jgi:CubicO group peptidase (beta-lactamase class C family)
MADIIEIAGEIDRVAADTEFAGVVRVDRGDETLFAKAYGMAHRAYRVPMTVDTQFGIASGVKTMTALTIVTLIEEGVLTLSTTARSLLGADLPLVDDRVTIEHLLAHRSGIGDFLDEDAGGDVNDYVLAVAPHVLTTTESYLGVLDGHPSKFAPGEDFSYCNGGFVLLALLAERSTGTSFHDLVTARVCKPAGMLDTQFLRSDALPGRAATGYLTSTEPTTNVLHLPVIGCGDGGIYSTAADIHRLWTAVFDGRVVSSDWVTEMIRPRSEVPSESRRYGLGFWLHETTDTVMMVGCDAGVSFQSARDGAQQITHTVLCTTARGAWPVTGRLDELFGT